MLEKPHSRYSKAYGGKTGTGTLGPLQLTCKAPSFRFLNIVPPEGVESMGVQSSGSASASASASESASRAVSDPPCH